MDEEKWNKAVAAYIEIKLTSSFLEFLPRSAKAQIEPKKYNYFDNSIILVQFERLFKLIQLKKALQGHQIEILVDKARTISAKVNEVYLFNKKANANFIYKSIECVEESQEKMYILF